MITRFIIKKHSIHSTEVIEVWYNGKLRATITPGDEGQSAMRVISTHIANVEKSFGVIEVHQFNFFTD